MSRPRVELIVCMAALLLIFILSLVLRIAVPWSHVFAGDWVKLTDNDAYFYMRLLDNLSQHFPLLGNFDPYYIFPAGKDLSGSPLFFVYFMGFFAWLLGGGMPSQHTVDLVGVYFPAVLGALLVFPVFFTGRAIFNKWAGLIAALLTALMPGEFLVRTLLGNTDSHAIEIFLTTFFMLFLLLTIGEGRDLKLYPAREMDRHKTALTLIYLLLAGLCLGIYLSSWEGALLFVFISFTWLVVQFISDHLRGRPVGYLGLIGCLLYGIALLISMSAPVSLMARLSLIMAILLSMLLTVLSVLLRRRNIKADYYPAAVAGAAIIAVAALLIISPQLLTGMLHALSNFFTWKFGTSIAETQPLLINQGDFTPALVWGNYTAASLLSLPALIIVIYRAIRRGEPKMILLAVWSLIILFSALAMRRFAYYLAINVAVLAGYTGWLIMQASGFKEIPADSVTANAGKKDNKKAGKKGKRSAAVKNRLAGAGNPVLMTLGIVAVIVLTVYPNTGPLPGGDRPFFDVASKALYAPSDAWCQALDWLREKTPEPFGDAKYYYAQYRAHAAGESYVNPPPDYSVVCWWDYGYWVTRIGHRVPVSNPGSAQIGEHYFFTAQDYRKAAEISANWHMKYIMVDDYTVDWNSGFGIIANAAQQSKSKYYEIYHRQQQGRLSPTLLYYPEYYQAMSVRLYYFDGKKYTPAESAVISWEDRVGSNGSPYREITGLKTFRSYEDAGNFIAAQKTGNWRIVGKDPNSSPVPLEALPGYRPVYSSSQKSKIGSFDIPAVKVFEYTGGAGLNE